LRLCFTCDEEIGRGVEHIRLEQLSAVAGYTLDGQGSDAIDVETFSADLAVVAIHGVNLHPGIAKGRMVNALRVAADLIGRLPRSTGCPETTEAREGFLHPFEIGGGVAEAKIQILVRDFDSQGLARWAELLRHVTASSRREFPTAKIDVTVTPQYRNMAEGLTREPRAVRCAQQALETLDAPPS